MAEKILLDKSDISGLIADLDIAKDELNEKINELKYIAENNELSNNLSEFNKKISDIQNIKDEIDDLKSKIVTTAAILQSKEEFAKESFLSISDKFNKTLLAFENRIDMLIEQKLSEKIDKKIASAAKMLKNNIKFLSEKNEKLDESRSELMQILQEDVADLKKEMSEYRFSKFYKVLTIINVAAYSILFYFCIKNFNAINAKINYIISLLH